MRTNSAIWAMLCAVLLCASPASPADFSAAQASGHAFASADPISRVDTLWIFDADFENLIGDNAGWVSEDLSERPACVNYWHKDTIRINGFEHLGDSTWWCGTYNDCWRQPRGYGNNWLCYLERGFPEIEAASEPGDTLVLQWDQRFALEYIYDYGYVDTSTDNGATWTTWYAANNPSFGTPGVSQDWDSQYHGHQELDLSGLAGMDFRLRFRMTSDVAYSSEDEYNNPPSNSCLDGAWQLDNITWTVNGDTIWVDDCESPGDNGWTHEDLPAEGQTGIVFERRFESFDGHSGWMMAAYDSVSGTMLDGQYSRLRSPLIDIDGAPELVVVSTGWLDLGMSGKDRVWMHLHGASDSACLWHGEEYSVLYGSAGEPTWMREELVTENLIDQSLLGLNLRLYNIDPIGTGHGVGFALDRVRIGVPIATHVPHGDTIAGGIKRVHPNPFNPSATIDFAVPTEGRVRLRVHDVAGRLVRALVDGEMEPGEYVTTWDGTDEAGARVASGVYMLRLEAGGQSLAPAKAVLLK